MVDYDMQEKFDRAFENISYEQAISILLGDQQLSDEQDLLMKSASYNGLVTFLPQAVGHIGFQVCDSPANNYSKLIVVPGTQLIRRRINHLRRNDLAAILKIEQAQADDIFTEVNGWQPAIDYVVALFNTFKSNPTINDNDLKRNHNICFWKNSQKRAVRALRRHFNVAMH